MYLAFNKENLKLHDSRDKINCETINPSTGNLYTQSDLDKPTELKSAIVNEMLNFK